MEMFYLVLSLNSTVVIPEKYTKEQCEAIKSSMNSVIGKICVPAPKPECKPFGRYCIYPNGDK